MVYWFYRVRQRLFSVATSTKKRRARRSGPDPSFVAVGHRSMSMRSWPAWYLVSFR